MCVRCTNDVSVFCARSMLRSRNLSLSLCNEKQWKRNRHLSSCLFWDISEPHWLDQSTQQISKTFPKWSNWTMHPFTVVCSPLKLWRLVSHLILPKSCMMWSIKQNACLNKKSFWSSRRCCSCLTSPELGLGLNQMLKKVEFMSICCNRFFLTACLHCLLLQIDMFKFSFCGDVEQFFATEPSIVPLSFSFLQACSKSVLSKIDHFTPTIDFMCIMIFIWTMNLEGSVAMLLEIKLDMVFLKEQLGALLLVEWIRANLGHVHHMRRTWKENLNMGRFGHFFLPVASFHACPAQPQRSHATLVLALGTSLVLVEWIRTNLGCGHHIEGIRKEDLKTGCFRTFPTCFSFCQVETSIHFATCLFLWQLSWKMSPNVSFCPSVGLLECPWKSQMSKTAVITVDWIAKSDCWNESEAQTTLLLSTG